MDDGEGGDFIEVYNGAYQPATTFFLKTGLTNGKPYRMRVSAMNYNGRSLVSSIATYYVCDAPTKFSAPVVVSQSTTAITLKWLAPEDDGGCSITGYAVFRDDGANGAISTEVNSSNDASIRNLPSLSQATITNFPASSDGFTFRFQIQVFTVQRNSLS